MQRIVEVGTEPIDLEAIEKNFSTPECGAVLTFRGIVRDHADGHVTDAIDYTCYDAMAKKELDAVVDRCLEAHPVSHVAVLHRTGVLEVGEASLGIVVASPHRAEAFACAAMIIDEIKKTVPIWKHEIGPDGKRWA
ncbi:MAG TPA: molybdenum cofactor biosynthesis protein MoaE [Planctomycetes bacterium]|nr:molybdenum cofactor biosynthesis protein MoaE [Planctomycetota bacterium]